MLLWWFLVVYFCFSSYSAMQRDSIYLTSSATTSICWRKTISASDTWIRTSNGYEYASMFIGFFVLVFFFMLIIYILNHLVKVVMDFFYLCVNFHVKIILNLTAIICYPLKWSSFWVLMCSEFLFNWHLLDQHLAFIIDLNSVLNLFSLCKLKQIFDQVVIIWQKKKLKKSILRVNLRLHLYQRC